MARENLIILYNVIKGLTDGSRRSQLELLEAFLHLPDSPESKQSTPCSSHICGMAMPKFELNQEKLHIHKHAESLAGLGIKSTSE